MFGRRTPATVDVAALGGAGFEIRGDIRWVEGVGDVNGDGLADISASVRFEDFMGRANAGSVYVVLERPRRGWSTWPPSATAASGSAGRGR